VHCCRLLWLACAGFSVEDYRFVRTTIKDIVIQTDMTHHAKLLQSVDTLVAIGPEGATGTKLIKSFTTTAARNTVLQVIVHAADISNTCRLPPPCGKWAKRVTDGAPSRCGSELNMPACTGTPPSPSQLPLQASRTLTSSSSTSPLFPLLPRSLNP